MEKRRSNVWHKISVYGFGGGAESLRIMENKTKLSQFSADQHNKLQSELINWHHAAHVDNVTFMKALNAFFVAPHSVKG